MVEVVVCRGARDNGVPVVTVTFDASTLNDDEVRQATARALQRVPLIVNGDRVRILDKSNLTVHVDANRQATAACDVKEIVLEFRRRCCSRTEVVDRARRDLGT